MTAAVRILLPLAVSATLASTLAQPALAAPRLQPVHVAATEVSFKDAKVQRALPMADALRAASTMEAAYYGPALPAAVMRIRIDKVGFKSAGKAVAGMLPLIGMFSGPNRNVMKGEVQLLDQSTGRLIAKYKIECDDDTDVSGSDAALAMGKMGLGFLPFGFLLESAVEMGEGAASKRDATERMLARGFVMLSYRKAYGDKLYKSFSTQRKAAFAAERVARQAAPVNVSAPAHTTLAPTTLASVPAVR